MEAIGQRAKAGLLVRSRSGRGKFVGADHQPAVRLATAQPPAVIDIDIAIAGGGQPLVDDQPGRGHDLFLVDIAVERVPAIPTHWR